MAIASLESRLCKEGIMEKDEIIIRNAIMHILNTNISQLEFSDTLLDLSSDINDFLRNHIYRIIISDETKECEFIKEESEIHNMIYGFLERNLITVSQQLAYKLFEIMYQNIDIPAADLFIVTFQVEGMIHMALLKMNYKETYIHSIEKGKDGISNSMVKQKVTLPSMSAKLQEAAVFNLHDYTLKVIEKKYEVNGVKSNYFSSMFLNCKPQLSAKAKLNIVTKTMEQINRKYYPDDFKKSMEAKSAIYVENIDNGSIRVSEIAEQLYSDKPDILEEFNEKLQKYNIQEDEVKAQKKTTIQKFEKQLLTTDQGIEINIPMEQYLDSRNISVITNPDGTMEVTIKNINNITAR
jgi:hypothetical protein